ncbi:class I SAM-dependent methyltransferase [Paenibacillus alginolyticus]|uniref:methyltransferase domain-containing protein n=1 Tax=Paenibacillus alginolyticus TaxID=59839 RepID=UPI0004074B84|nr:methyltransferase domain-containing protein [Paenibacillus alginolyticus]MCY9668252.1 class I SAM-dependent methyltransferase [Paenibacillus alginolyticus]
MDNQSIENAIINNCYLKSGYQSRNQPRYCYDSLGDGIWQPQVYALARYLGTNLNCKYVIDLGCGIAFKLTKLYPDFHIIGVDYGANLQVCMSKYPYGTWIEHNLDSPQKLILQESILKDSIIICADVIEHLVNPAYLLWNLKEMMGLSSVCLLSTPERDIERGIDHFGPPQNPSHVQEWNLSELTNLFRSLHFNIKYTGLTVSDNISNTKRTSLLVLGNNDPSDYRSKLLDSVEIRTNIDRII